MPNAPYPTLSAFTEAGLARNVPGVAAAVKRKGAWEETTVDAFRRQVREAALGLYDLGLRRGDRVALHAENSTRWLVADQAVLALGAITVPIYTTQPADQIRFILADCHARAYLVSSAELLAPLLPFLDALPALETTVGLFGRYAEAMLTFEELCARGRRHDDAAPERFDALRAAVAPDDLATFVYTSGTTGQPKGVMLTHANITSNALAVQDRLPFDVDRLRNERMLSYLPLSHTLERMATFMYLHLGYPIYFVEDVQEILADLKTVRPIHFATVPRLLEKLYAGFHVRIEETHGLAGRLGRWALRRADAYDVEETSGPLGRLSDALADRLVFRRLRGLFGGRLQAVTSGGAGLPAPVMNFFNALGIICGQGYGLTETAPVVSIYRRDRLRAGSAGLPLTNVEVRIADDGEILVRGPNVMVGYHGLPDETAATLSPDGWFHTGDIGHLDPDGHLFITDRKKQLLKLSTGKYVAPTPIEEALALHPLVEQAVVVGNECKFCAALIVPDSDAVRRRLDALDDAAWTDDPRVHALIQDAVDAANANRSAWEQVKKFHLLAQPFSIEGGELTPTLKVRRRVVHDKYAAAIEALYT